MLAEGIHSLVDTGNELLVLLGLTRSRLLTDEVHPFYESKEPLIGKSADRDLVKRVREIVVRSGYVHSDDVAVGAVGNPFSICHVERFGAINVTLAKYAA